MKKTDHLSKVTGAGLLVALGIIYGDIGTSPLYVLKAIVGEGKPIHGLLVYGGISCIFWTLTLQTTIKYVVLTLRADNNGEGGIFALYALIRKNAKWLSIPAIAGGSALLADGIITPPISVASAVEGLRIVYPTIPTVPIVIAIITGLFLLQGFGTKAVGKLFGPVMLLWFSMLAFLGISAIVQHPAILQAVNPYYGYQLLTQYPGGFWQLGAVFLCTTGAEALYSDLGHCGRGNIRVSWAFVKTCLLLNYFGQGAYLVAFEGQPLTQNPFYSLMPQGFLMIGIGISTLATVIASQALISGSFTLVSEAMRLTFWPKVTINYPSDLRGQLYVPSMNLLLWLGCVGIVLYFRESSNMEAAYGLAITLTMLMTTILLSYYLHSRRYPKWFTGLFLVLYLGIELSFLAANLSKFPHGGWVSIAIGGLLALLMYVWVRAHRIKDHLVNYESLIKQLPNLQELSFDETVPKYATHLVFLSDSPDTQQIEKNAFDSIFLNGPKRADIYWFIHVETLDEPYRTEYEVQELAYQDVITITFRLGFRVEPRIGLYFRTVVQEMVESKEVDIVSRYESLQRKHITGDFKFIVFESFLSYENELTWEERWIMKPYFFLKNFTLRANRWYQLDNNLVQVETVPLVIRPVQNIRLVRVGSKSSNLNQIPPGALSQPANRKQPPLPTDE